MSPAGSFSPMSFSSAVGLNVVVTKFWAKVKCFWAWSTWRTLSAESVIVAHGHLQLLLHKWDVYTHPGQAVAAAGLNNAPVPGAGNCWAGLQTQGSPTGLKHSTHAHVLTLSLPCSLCLAILFLHRTESWRKRKAQCQNQTAYANTTETAGTKSRNSESKRRL